MEEKGEKPKGRRLRAKVKERRKAERVLRAGRKGDWWTVGRRLRAKEGERRKTGRELGEFAKESFGSERRYPSHWWWFQIKMLEKTNNEGDKGSMEVKGGEA
jgi:hypothetical protein